LKIDFVVFDEAMYQSVERPCGHIFWIFDFEKSDFDEVMF
jgi:hypothetical protein